jgi:hypothetical protein
MFSMQRWDRWISIQELLGRIVYWINIKIININRFTKATIAIITIDVDVWDRLYGAW